MSEENFLGPRHYASIRRSGFGGSSISGGLTYNLLLRASWPGRAVLPRVRIQTLLFEELVNLIDDHPHLFQQFAALWRGAATSQVIRQDIESLREALESVRSHEPGRLP
jgi:hypothetical protein